MFITLRLRHIILFILLISSFFVLSSYYRTNLLLRAVNSEKSEKSKKNNFIKWVDFNISYNALKDAMNADIKTSSTEFHINWIEALSYLAAKNGGSFKSYKKSDLDSYINEIKSGKTQKDLTKGLKYYDYYFNAYSAVLDAYIGSYGEESPIDSDSETKEWRENYGLKVFSPIAAGYGYTHFDDFGSSRTYGYARKHLGHDLMGSVGTPVIAIESGKVEALGWNRYGGWRIGIRSFDNKRYYYYAHLRKDHPYQSGLKEGDTVTAGDVIGYLGMTGYSTKENTNNIDTPHLHFGIQLIFDESQKDGNGEIWIDCYSLTKLLSLNQSEVVYDKDKKEYSRKYNLYEFNNGGTT